MVQLDPHFKYVFSRVFFLTCLLLVLWVSLAVFLPSSANEAQKALLQGISHAFAGCVGFLIGGLTPRRMAATRHPRGPKGGRP